jgi:hypothetical protein
MVAMCGGSRSPRRLDQLGAREQRLTLIFTIPAVMPMFLGQRFIVSGLTLGAVK